MALQSPATIGSLGKYKDPDFCVRVGLTGDGSCSAISGNDIDGEQKITKKRKNHDYYDDDLGYMTMAHEGASSGFSADLATSSEVQTISMHAGSFWA